MEGFVQVGESSLEPRIEISLPSNHLTHRDLEAVRSFLNADIHSLLSGNYADDILP